MANIVDIVIKGVDKSKQALNTPLKGLKDLKTAASQLGPAFKLGATAAVGALGVLAKQSIDSADTLGKTASRLGITTEALSTLRFAANQAGTDTKTFDLALQRFTRRTAEAAQGTGEAKGALQELGISLKDSQGNMKPTEALLKEVANAMGGVKNEQDKVRVAFKLFDAEGVKLLNLLEGGADGMEKMQQKARQLGLEIGKDQAENAARFNDSMKILKEGVTGAANQVVGALLPGLVQMAEGFAGAADGPTKMNDAIQGTISFLKFLGKVALSVVQGIITYFDLAGNAIGTVAFALFELVTGNINGAKEAISGGLGEILEKSQEASDNLAAIWTEKPTGPQPPKVEEHAQATEDILAINRAAAEEERKRAEDQKRRDKEVAEAKKKAAIDAAALEKRLEANRKENFKSTGQFILDGARNLAKEGSAVAKAAAIAQATIDGIVAVQKALASAPYPYNIALAAIVGGITAANIAKIAGVQGFQEGGILGGNSPAGDRQLFLGNSGELILNRAQQANIAGQLEAGGESGRPLRVQVMMDSRVIIDQVSEASKDGTLVIDARAVRA